METTRALLERLRAHVATPEKRCSDYRLAQVLDVSKSAMVRYMRHEGGMASDVALRLAELIGAQPQYVLACMAWEREQFAEAKPYWEMLATGVVGEKTARVAARAKRTGKVAAAALALGIMGFGAPSPSYSAPASAQSLYIMTNRRRVTNPLYPPRTGRPRRPRRTRKLASPAVSPVEAAT